MDGFMDGWRDGLFLCASFTLLNAPCCGLGAKDEIKFDLTSYFSRVGFKFFCCYFFNIVIPCCRIHRIIEPQDG